MSNAMVQQAKQLTDMRSYLEQARTKLAEVVPKHLTPERLVRVAVAAMSRSPKLLLCTRESVLLAIMEAGQLGLEAGSPLGHAYLVPFEDRKRGQMVATLIIGYKGLIELARRSGQVSSCEARVVYERDTFDVEFGLTPRLVHRPHLGADRGQPVLGYAVIKMKDGADAIVEIMTRAEIEGIRARSRAANEGPWVTDWEAMARKTVMRRAMKYAPMPTSVAEAMAHDDAAESPQVTVAEPVDEPPTTTGDPRLEALKSTIRRKRRDIEIDPATAEDHPEAPAETKNVDTDHGDAVA